MGHHPLEWFLTSVSESAKTIVALLYTFFLVTAFLSTLTFYSFLWLSHSGSPALLYFLDVNSVTNISSSKLLCFLIPYSIIHWHIEMTNVYWATALFKIPFEGRRHIHNQYRKNSWSHESHVLVQGEDRETRNKQYILFAILMNTRKKTMHTKREESDNGEDNGILHSVPQNAYLLFLPSRTGIPKNSFFFHL